MTQTESLSRGAFLPYLSLAAAPDGHAVQLRSSGRHATTVVRIHSANCESCRRYLAELARGIDDFTWWGGRIIVLIPGSFAEALALERELNLPFIVASEPDELPALIDDDAGMVIADRYGHVYFVGNAGEGHAFPPPAEIEEWFKFLGTQCPE